MTFRNRKWKAAFVFISGFTFYASTLALAQQKDLPGKQPPANQQINKEPNRELTPKEKKQQQLAASIKWQDGPCDGKIGTVASIKVPAGYHFTEGSGARAYLELLGNPPQPKTLAVLEPIDDNIKWLVEFSYEDVGYVKDDEKDKIDANAILESIKAGNAEGNKQRAAMGAAPLDVIGWEKPPFYDSRTNRLTWAIRGQSQGVFVVNYNTRLLGRGGVMSANLIIEPNELDKTLPEFEKLLAGYSYVSGQKYSEFRSGDRVAEYGLAALVAGGALAVAAKTGLLAKLIKPLIVGAVIVGGFFAKFFRKIFGKSQTS